MTDIGITSIGVHVPAARLERRVIAEAHAWAFPGLKSEGKGEKAFCNWDEDVITMAVAAARNCVAAADRGAISELVLASTTAPFADLGNAAIVSTAIALGQDVPTRDIGGTVRAGTSALIDALRTAREDVLVIASDVPGAAPASLDELRSGCAAVAIRTGTGPLLARHLASVSRTRPFVDHFRRAGRDHDYGWEERWVRDVGFAQIAAGTVRDALEQAGKAGSDVKFLVAGSKVSGAERTLAKAAGLTNAQFVDKPQGMCGHAGTAASLLQLALVLEEAEPGDLIVVVSFGYGCDVIVLEASAGVTSLRTTAPASTALARRHPEPAYLRYLTYTGAIRPDFGMRSEFDPKSSLTQVYRSSDQLNAFVAGQCADCGTVQFPVLPACVKCASTAEKKPHPLADESATMVTFTADHLSFHLSPPLYMGLAQFDSGARVFMEVVDIAPGTDVAVGMPVRMVFRRKDVDATRGYIRYFWKAATLD